MHDPAWARNLRALSGNTVKWGDEQVRYTHFEIHNFKGAESVRLDLMSPPRGKVHTLVGLNESGKTTILEAINLLMYRESLAALELPGYAQRDPHDLIPISKRANFNGEISIKAGVSMSEADRQGIATRLRKEMNLAEITMSDTFEIHQTYKFNASRVAAPKPSVTWPKLNMKVRQVGKRKLESVKGGQWSTAVTIIRSMLPKIAYFPNFLFDFPDRIYLEKAPEEEEKHELYRSVLQDVLDALGEGLTIEEHVLARANSSEPFDKRSLESVLLKMGAHITKTVFSKWNTIFKRKATGKAIKVSINREGEGPWFLQLRLADNDEIYEISERSLGFRWFFAYLLLTQYRGFRQSDLSSVLFLFDEPASNLHPSAQTQLLDSFAQIPEGCGVIYTTHSHHLIKPEWLESAFVVKNEGIEYGVEDSDSTPRRTLVTVQRYREFAAQHPNQVTYFQPILDVLDYSPSKLQDVPAAVMLEGKGDYYVIRLMQQSLKAVEPAVLMPGGGASGLDTVIQLYIGWARDFVILLDSDQEGHRQRDRYVEKFGGLLRSRIVLLHEINDAWKGKSIEGLFEKGELLTIQQEVYPTATQFTKTHFHRAVQELVVTRRCVVVGERTIEHFKNLLQTLQERLVKLAL